MFNMFTILFLSNLECRKIHHETLRFPKRPGSCRCPHSWTWSYFLPPKEVFSQQSWGLDPQAMSILPRKRHTSIDLFLFGFPSPACCLDLGVSGTMMHHIHQFVVLRVEHRARVLFSKFTIKVLWPTPRGSHQSQYIRSLPTTNAWNNLRMFSPRHPWWSLRLVGCFSEAERRAWLRVL